MTESKSTRSGGGVTGLEATVAAPMTPATNGAPHGDDSLAPTLAAALSHPSAVDVSGSGAMADMPFDGRYEMRRVIGAGGRLGGYSARTGLLMKRRLLAMERAALGEAESAVPGETAFV